MTGRVVVVPEVIRGGTADERGDIFSLGLTLRFALCGEEAFASLPMRQLIRAMRDVPMPLPPVRLSEPFATSLRWLIASDPAERAPGARAALRALDAVERRLGQTAPSVRREVARS